MTLRNQHLTHWIAAFAMLMSTLAPAVSQAVSLSKHGQGFAMEICAVDGSKLQVHIQSEEQDNLAESAQLCPYCAAHSSIIPAFNTKLKFQAPQTLALLQQLFYQSPKPPSVWITPPSTAPPTQA